MVGFPIVAVGYEVADALETRRYERQHHLEEVSYFKEFLRYDVETEISMPVSLARLEDYSDLTPSRMFRCCYVDIRDKVYVCEEVMAVTVPPQFMHVAANEGTTGH